MKQDKNQTTIKLPERLVSSVDLSRINRELKALDIWLTQAGLRSGGDSVSAPKTSATLEEVARINGVSLLDKTHREQLINVLSAFLDHAPKIHMSFAVEPSAIFLNRMIVWLRQNISPIVLLEIGLQPTITAGCTVRTDNKVFDLSLRHRFVESRPLLVQSIAKFQDAPMVQQPTTEAVQNTTAPLPPAPSPAPAPVNTQQPIPTPTPAPTAQPEPSKPMTLADKPIEAVQKPAETVAPQGEAK